MMNRHVNSPFWTAERDTLLQKLQGAGLPLEKIAKQLSVTPSAVLRRSHHLRGLKFSLDRVRASALEGRKQRQKAAITAMRAAIRRGIPRDTIIAEAVKSGLRRTIIADEFGLTLETVLNVALLAGGPKSSSRGRPRRGARPHSRPGYHELLKVKRAERRRQKQRLARDVIAAMHSAISRGVARDSAVAQAIKTGATYSAIGNELGLSRQRVHQIVLRQEALNSPLRTDSMPQKVQRKPVGPAF